MDLKLVDIPSPPVMPVSHDIRPRLIANRANPDAYTRSIELGAIFLRFVHVGRYRMLC